MSGVGGRRSRLASRLVPLLDPILAPLAGLASRFLWLMRRLTFQRLPLTARAVAWGGVYPLIDHYYEPLIDAGPVAPVLDTPRALPGIDLRVAEASAFLETLAESRDLETAVAAGLVSESFTLDNGTFPGGDADALYGMVRRLRPARVIEVGCGNSTHVLAAALRQNETDGAPPARMLCVEPYEAPWLSDMPIEVLREPVERLDPSIVEQLAENDVLFIDSSHMIRPQGDVAFIFLNLIPRLAPGVYVHIHDVFTPRDYPSSLLVDHRVFWNEQYLLEAFLCGHRDFEVVLPLNHLWWKNRALVERACPGILHAPGVRPASFWMRRSKG